jgi:DNA-binding SARP family transcriptional activator
MEFRVLGPVEVEEGGRRVALGGPKPRALLAILLLRRGEVVPAERLIELLYEGLPPEKAAKSVQAHVSRLRKALGESRLRTAGGGYAVAVSPEELDLDRFDELVERGRSALAASDPEAASTSLRQGLALWRGPPFADFRYSEFAQAEIARLEERRLAVLEDRIEADLALGRHADVVSELEALVHEHPLRERLRTQLMLALYRSGRQAEALDVYQDTRRALTEELGIEPSQELRELQQAILRQDPALSLKRSRRIPSDGPSPRGIFVGRARELEALEDGLEAAIAGHGRVFLLVGEPGIGKSRLAEELVQQAHTRGVRVVVGRCWEAGGAPAYWPWVQSLRALAEETESEVLRRQLGPRARELTQLLPELRERFPDLPLPTELESESARFLLFEAVSAFLDASARETPLVIILDDLHAADEPSLLLLQFVARELGKSRVLVLGVYRDVDPTPTHPLTVAVTEVLREPFTRRMALTGLAREDVATFVELISGEVPSDALVAAMHEETEGNPLFVSEIVRLLATEGGLEQTEEPRLVIPQGVRDVISRRLGHLSEECNHVLVVASVLGREFSLEAIAQVADMSEDEVLGTLDEAMVARVVSAAPGAHDHLRFAHVLIRDTLYDGLTVARRVRLHRQVVAALETLHGADPGPHSAELSLHALAGSEFEKALEYARQAGDRALALLAYEEAARLYRTALDALELVASSGEDMRCVLLLALGEATARAGDDAAARNAFLAAAAIAERLGRPLELAQAAAGYGGRIVWARGGDDPNLVPLLERALDALGDDDVGLRVRLLARLAGALRDDADVERRDALSREALALSRRSGDPLALALALDGLTATAHGTPDRVPELLADADELLSGAERGGDRERVMHAHFNRAYAHFRGADASAAIQDLATASRLADDLRQPTQLWLVTAGLAAAAIAEGRFDDADDLDARALEIGRRAQPRDADAVWRLHRHMLGELRDLSAETEAVVAEGAARYATRPIFRCALGQIHLQLGDADRARQIVRDLADAEFESIPLDSDWIVATTILAELSAALHEHNAAATIHALLVPMAHLNASNLPEAMRGSVARFVALLDAALGRQDEAARRFEDALGANGAMGFRPWLALTQVDYARTLLVRDGPSDADSAQCLLKEALATYRELGMTGPLERARDVLGAYPSVDRVGPSGSGS